MKAFPPTHFYHIAEPGNLPSIMRDGLLSTERLVMREPLGAAEREAILGRHRPASVTLPSGTVIRDQIPMPPRALEAALLDGMTSSDWYRLLNGFVFLWANEDRVERHFHAFKGKPQVLLTLDAARLLADLGDRVFVSPINSGNARRKPAVRSRALFVPYREWLRNGWVPIASRQRSRSDLPVEIAVEGHLPLKPYLLHESPESA